MTARKTVDTTVTPDFEEGADVTQTPSDWEFETVAEGAPTGIIFENPGESFIGQYVDDHHVDREPAADGSDQSFDLFIFKGRDGERYSLNKSYALEQAMEKVNKGDWCRITYTKDVKTSRNLNPMKDFRVDVRR